MISVVDDDAAVRDMLVSLVQSLGYEAHAFSCAEELLASRHVEECECTITDIYMTGMNGFELKERLDARGDLSPVIMITAHTEPDLEERAVASGAICLLRKPFEVEALITCIENAMKA